MGGAITIKSAPTWKTTLAAIVCALLAGCATTSQPDPVDLSALDSVRETDGPVAGPWTPLEDGVTNMVPSNVEVMEGQVRDGTGVSIGLVKGFNAKNLVIEANVNFSGGGAPALIFRAQEKDGVITAMYAVTLFVNGVNVWRFADGRWMLLMSQAVPMAPRSPHALRAEAKDDRIQVYADGQRMSEVKDDGLSVAGRAGIRAVEGPCKFSGLHVSKR